MKRESVSFAVAAFFAITNAFAIESPELKSFSYRLKVPAAGVSCQANAEAVASEFARAAVDAQAVQGTCQDRLTITEPGGSYDLDVVIVSYKAARELRPQRSVFGAVEFMGQGDPDAGVFKTYSECLSAMAAQSPIFEMETGLRPFAAYCQASTRPLFPGYSLTLESFGKAKRRLFSFSRDGGAQYGHDESRLLNAANAAISELGGRVAWSDSSRSFYYAEYRLPITVRSFGIFREASHCSTQVDQALAIFAKAQLRSVTAFCHAYAPTGSSRTSSVLIAVGGGQHSLFQRTSGEHYSSFSECLGDLDRLLKNAQSSGRPAYGAICAHSSEGGFRAHLHSEL